MRSRNVDWDGYRGLTRLLMLAVILAVVLWWAVAVNGPRRPVAKPTERKPEAAPPSDRAPVRMGSFHGTADERVSIERGGEAREPVEIDDDYWPDIIDA